MQPGSIAVIIPTWNEAALVADAVETAGHIGDEVIVVDAGSPDVTAALAREAGATVVHAPKGRGIQLHAGASGAAPDILLFLHADARLLPDARGAIRGALSDPRTIGGNFLIRFLPESWFTRYLAPANDLRCRLTRRYYGDSGIFVRREVYGRIGGFRPWPLFEDYDFSRRMEHAGRCAYIRDVSVYASARRFEGREIRTFFTWIGLQALYSLGAAPERLARAYPDTRSGDPERFLGAWHSLRDRALQRGR